MSTKLPACLQRPLRFGDKEQIEALNKIEQEIREQEERSGGLSETILKKFRVEIWFEGREIVEVWARDKEQAENIAYDMDIEPDSWDIERTEAEEVKP